MAGMYRWMNGNIFGMPDDSETLRAWDVALSHVDGDVQGLREAGFLRLEVFEDWLSIWKVPNGFGNYRYILDVTLHGYCVPVAVSDWPDLWEARDYFLKKLLRAQQARNILDLDE